MALYFDYFSSKNVERLQKALTFVEEKIIQDWDEKLASVNATHHYVIKQERNEELQKVRLTMQALNESVAPGVSRIGFIDPPPQWIMDICRSALENYLRDISKTKAETNSHKFDEIISEIEELENTKWLKNANSNLFDKYHPSASIKKAQNLEVFLSYSHEDKYLAGKIRNILVEKGVAVFLAHEDIEVSKEWRVKIHERLRNCSVLLALLTPNFEKSVWANKEAGYFYGKEGKVIPLIVRGTDITKFGFLEALQAVTVTEDRLADCVAEILENIAR